MSILFREIIYGPVRSRRLGVSLGVNLLPLNGKLCSFNCIYCECGWNEDNRVAKPRFNCREDVRDTLKAKLQEMSKEGTLPDVITFAGNGEPTLHPDFKDIINDTITLRNKFAPNAKISVLSNATQLHRKDVCDALAKVDNNILKLDSAINATAKAIDLPSGSYDTERIIEQMQQFKGQMTLQTMFLRGNHAGRIIDNTTEEEVQAWLSAVKRISPRDVMVYSIDRATPCQELEKVPHDELEAIAERVRALGFACSVA